MYSLTERQRQLDTGTTEEVQNQKTIRSRVGAQTAIRNSY